MRAELSLSNLSKSIFKGKREVPTARRRREVELGHVSTLSITLKA